MHIHGGARRPGYRISQVGQVPVHPSTARPRPRPRYLCVSPRREPAPPLPPPPSRLSVFSPILAPFPLPFPFGLKDGGNNNDDDVVDDNHSGERGGAAKKGRGRGGRRGRGSTSDGSPIQSGRQPGDWGRNERVVRYVCSKYPSHPFNGPHPRPFSLPGPIHPMGTSAQPRPAALLSPCLAAGTWRRLCAKYVVLSYIHGG